MPSRLALGKSTNASARFDALFRVIARLCSMLRVTDRAAAQSVVVVNLRFPPGSGCEVDARGDVAFCGDSVVLHCQWRRFAQRSTRRGSRLRRDGGDDDDG